MHIALYPSHHNLPFWHSPKQPTEMFSVEIGTRIMRVYDGDNAGWARKEIRQTSMWPILMGLHSMQGNAMAHVSAFYEDTEKENLWHSPKRKWVQITTMPEKWNGDLPRIVEEDGTVLVKHLWGGDNKTYHPVQFLPHTEQDEEKSPEFWGNLFLERIAEEKRKALREVTRTKRELHIFMSAFPSLT